MIIAAVASVMMSMFGGGAGGWGVPQWIDAVSKQAEKVIVEPDRRQSAQDVLDSMQSEYQQFIQGVESRHQELAAVDMKYDATKEQYQAIFDDLDATWNAWEKKQYDLTTQLRQLVSEDEWNAIMAEVRKDWK